MHGNMSRMNQQLTYLTTSEVAARVRVDSSTVRRWAIEGTLPARITPGGHYRFRPEDVDALLSREVAA